MMDPSRDDMVKYLSHQVTNTPQIDCDIADLEAAIYWFAANYHGGQASNLYRALSASPYRPSRTEGSAGDAGHDALLLYNHLVGAFCGEEAMA